MFSSYGYSVHDAESNLFRWQLSLGGGLMPNRQVVGDDKVPLGVLVVVQPIRVARKFLLYLVEYPSGLPTVELSLLPAANIQHKPLCRSQVDTQHRQTRCGMPVYERVNSAFSLRNYPQPIPKISLVLI